MAANNYTINFVDPTKSTIDVLPDTVDGPRNPAIRKTDLDLIGMGSALWGEAILENLIHLLENFSSEEDIHQISSIVDVNNFTISGDVTLAFPAGRVFDIWDSDTNNGTYTVVSSSYSSGVTTVTVSTNLNVGSINLGLAGKIGIPNKASQFAPIKPVQGQLWYNQTRGQIYVYELIGSPLAGNWRRVGGITISDTEPTAPSQGDLWWETTVYTPDSDEYGRNLRIYIGNTWVRVSENYLPRDGSKSMQGNLNMGANNITNMADPTDPPNTLPSNVTEPTEAVTVGWADDRYVNATGDTVTGNLTVDGDTTVNGLLRANAKINAGGTAIENVADPNTPDDAVNLGFADNRYVNVTGDTMTGTLSFNGIAEIINNFTANGIYAIKQQDGAGRVSHLWNAEWDGPTATHYYTTTGEPALWMLFNSNRITIRHAPAGIAGDPISWVGSTDIYGDQILINGSQVLTNANFESNKTESIQDIVGGMVTGNSETGINVTYDDVNGKLNFQVTGQVDISYNGTGYRDSANNYVGEALKVVFGSTTKYVPSRDVACGCTCTCTCTCTCNCAHSKCIKWG